MIFLLVNSSGGMFQSLVVLLKEDLWHVVLFHCFVANVRSSGKDNLVPFGCFSVMATRSHKVIHKSHVHCIFS